MLSSHSKWRQTDSFICIIYFLYSFVIHRIQQIGWSVSSSVFFLILALTAQVLQMRFPSWLNGFILISLKLPGPTPHLSTTSIFPDRKIMQNGCFWMLPCFWFNDHDATVLSLLHNNNADFTRLSQGSSDVLFFLRYFLSLIPGFRPREMIALTKIRFDWRCACQTQY